VGEIVGVDYIGSLVNNKSPAQIKTWVPYAVSAIISSVDVTSLLTIVHITNMSIFYFYFFAFWQSASPMRLCVTDL
jgi:hypothetical protein